jgi:hypothetical protein
VRLLRERVAKSRRASRRSHALSLPRARAFGAPYPPQYFAFYDGGDNKGCYHRVTDGWPISRLDTSAIGGSWDAPTRALVLFQVRAPRIRPATLAL